MNDQDLGIHSGDRLHIEFVGDGTGVRHNVVVVGMLPGVSLLITSPMLADGRIKMVREGQIVVARAFARDRAYAFVARVVRVCTSPVPYLHLNVMERREQVTVRRSARASVVLGGWAQRETDGQWTDDYAIVIRDAGTAGLSFEAAHVLGAIGDRLRLRTRLALGELGKQEFTAVVNLRYVAERDGDDGKIKHGVELAEVDRIDAIALRAFVYEQLAEGSALAMTQPQPARRVA